MKETLAKAIVVCSIFFSVGAFVALHVPKTSINMLYLPAFGGVCIAFGLYCAKSKMK